MLSAASYEVWGVLVTSSHIILSSVRQGTVGALRTTSLQALNRELLPICSPPTAHDAHPGLFRQYRRVLHAPWHRRVLPRLQGRFKSDELTPVLDPIAKLKRECRALRLKLASAERPERNSLAPPPCGYRTAPTSARTPPHTSLSPHSTTCWCHATLRGRMSRSSSSSSWSGTRR